MRLLLIRHGIAEEQEIWARTGHSDDERPLTDEGRRKMTLNAKGIHRAIDAIDLLATSPLVRARQTAQIVADAFKFNRIEATKALVPGAPMRDFVEWLGRHGDMKVIAAVGHEPHLGILATWLMTDIEDSRVELKKGAACLLEFDGAPESGTGRLCWSIAPAQLRDMAGD
ncbi:MAG TPA: phosphohistidine phosphatase SixA [Gemmatimonadaceae bacterium]|nr:phosphohistidine phosphatase SixA [Gemmatimonadaceae bacterium]